MDEIKISKIKLRRGTNVQRQSVILDQGELVVTTDTQRLYVGNGVLSGGISPASKIHSILTNVQSLTSTNAETNDIAFANNGMYVLSGSNFRILSAWANVSPKLGSQLEYLPNNSISIKLSSLSASFIDPSTVRNGITIQNNNLQVNFNSKSLNVSANKLEVKQGGIDEFELASSTFTNGITGGNSNKVGLRIDPTQFYYNSGVLSISSVPTGSLTFASINSGWIGDGLIYDNIGQKIKSVLTDVDNNTLTKNVSGIISISPGIVPQNIFGVLTGASITNGTNTLSSIFNGNPSHTITGAIPGLALTTFNAISSNGLTTQSIKLTSAGFLTFPGNINTQTGELVGRYAIPIFAY